MNELQEFARKEFERIENNKEHIFRIMSNSIFLERTVIDLIKDRARLLNSTKLLRYAEDEDISISDKLRLLRFTDTIDEGTYLTATTLISIRNKVAHLNFDKAYKEEQKLIKKLYSKPIKDEEHLLTIYENMTEECTDELWRKFKVKRID